jgi:HD-GYP domain-containing protein (c-di-GMP phosphodiesterase class II)
MGELVALLALAQDNAFGQPLESQFRSCILADRLTEQLGLGPDERATAYWVALLRYVGCTGHAHEVSALFGDEIGLRARTLVHDAGDPHEVVADFIDFVAADPVRLPIVQHVMQLGRDAFVPNFAAGCEIGDALAARLGMSLEVRDALRCTFERWNGQGFPNGTAGAAIPLAMRIVHLTHDVEAIARLRSPAAAMAAAAGRRDRTYDPALVDVFVEHGSAWLDELASLDPWATVLASEPQPRRVVSGADLDEALTVVADFVDVKSPFMAGHSRRCADLAATAATRVELDPKDVTALRRAALVHDLGTTAVPNSIWDKPGPLTAAELDRVRLHPMLTEQMLRRLPGLASVTAIAAAHHERADGSGYHRGVRRDPADLASSVLATCDVYVGLTADRADRTARTDREAAAHVRELVAAGGLDGRAADAVLAAAGHVVGRRGAKPDRPGGLTAREAEVLALAAQGHTVKAIGERLYISTKTADHHLQHVYTKIGVSSRGAAALWAMQHGIVG